MFSFGQELKFLKTWEKHIYKHTRVVLWKKPLEKNNNNNNNKKYSRNERILKVGHLAKAIAFATCSVWVNKLKWSRNMPKTTLQAH